MTGPEKPRWLTEGSTVTGGKRLWKPGEQRRWWQRLWRLVSGRDETPR